MSRQQNPSPRNPDFFQNLFDKPVKLDKWDTIGVKHGLDDVIKKVFNKGLNFKESNQLTDAKIVVSGLSVLLALIAFVYDYLTGYPASFLVLLFCVSGYALLMLSLYIFSFLFEKSYVYSGTARDSSGFTTNATIQVSTSLKRFEHNYAVTICYRDTGNGALRVMSQSCSIAELFDAKGNLGLDIFGAFIYKLYTSAKS